MYFTDFDASRSGKLYSRFMTTIAVASLFGLTMGCNGFISGAENDTDRGGPPTQSGEERSFGAVQPVALTPAGDGCDAVGAIDGDATMQMIFLDDTQETLSITDVDTISDEAIDISGEDISFSQGTVYSVPDIECTSSDDCPGNHQCRATDLDSVGNRCQSETDINVDGDPRFVGERNESQAFAVGISTRGRWRGWYSSDFDGLHAFDESGPNQELSMAPLDNPGEIAVDGASMRQSALAPDLARSWGYLSENVMDDGREAHFGFWTFGEAPAEVRSRVAEVSDDNWASDPDDAKNALGSLPQTDSGRSNIYNSIIEVIQQGFGEGAGAAAEHKSLVFIVAGHDEVRRSSAEDVVEVARAKGVEVSILQIDAERDPELLRDDWTYYEDDAPCTSDADCANFENCRQPTMYTSDPDTDSIDDVDYPAQEQRGETFCLPDYDENGRLGPVGEYQQIACETGGSYIYLPEAERDAIADPLEGLVFAPDGVWEFDFSINNPQLFEQDGAAQLLETEMEVTIDRTQVASFGWNDSTDRRQAFFTPVQ